MSGVDKEALVNTDSNPEVKQSKTEETTSIRKMPETLTAKVPEVPTAETVKQAIPSPGTTTPEKGTRIFGSFNPITTDKPGESQGNVHSKPLFGGFTSASSGASAWTAPTAVGGFAASSSFGFTKKEEPEEKEEVGGDEVPESPEVHFEPLVKLEEVAVSTNEEDETVEFKM